MKKETASKLADEIMQLREDINRLIEWRTRYIVRAIVQKAFNETAIDCSNLKEGIEKTLMEL
jgi:hypothetical protein